MAHLLLSLSVAVSNAVASRDLVEAVGPSWANLTLYHINPLSFPAGYIDNMDLGDLGGDLFFDLSNVYNVFACSVKPATPGVICDNAETAGDAIGVTKLQVEVATQWGPCTPRLEASTVLHGTNSKLTYDS